MTEPPVPPPPPGWRPPPPAPPIPPGPPPAPVPVGAIRRWPPLPEGWWRGTAPHAVFPVPFGIGDGFVVFGWSMIGQLVIGVPLALVFGFAGADLLDSVPNLTLVLVTQALLLVTSLWYLQLRRRLDWRLLGPVAPSVTHVGWGLVVGVGGFLTIQLGAGLLLTLLGDTDVPQQSLLQEVGGTTAATVLVALVAIVGAPVIEEVVFRGVLFQGLRRELGLWPAAVISSIAFGVVHYEVIGFSAFPSVVAAAALLSIAMVPRLPLPLRLVLGLSGLAALVYAVAVGGPSAVVLPTALGLLGLLFALAFHRLGGLVVPIVGHAAFNAMGVGLTLAMGDGTLAAG